MTTVLTTAGNQGDNETLTGAVRDHYAAAAQRSLTLLESATPASASCCGPSCCSGTEAGCDPISADLYDEAAAETSASALAASLGCGNPTALVDLHPGEVVLDLGSGGGLDVLLSARRVAPTGRAYGLDMTPEMLALARRHQAEAGVTNAEFIEGVIEDIPLPDASVDVVISNCVINLSADKDAVLSEAHRVLRPGGRFAVSDIVLTRELPDPLVRIVGLWTGCVAGALVEEDYLARLARAGFEAASIQVTRTFETDEVADFAELLPEPELPVGFDRSSLVDALAGAFASAFIRARRP